MKVAYIFSTSGHTVSYKLGQMILPQLEDHRHGAEVVGMFFFDDNTFALRRGDPLGERLARGESRAQIERTAQSFEQELRAEPALR